MLYDGFDADIRMWAQERHFTHTYRRLTENRQGLEPTSDIALSSALRKGAGLLRLPTTLLSMLRTTFKTHLTTQLTALRV